MPETEPALLGCVADDVTGATDLAINLVQGGLRVVQFLAVPTAEELNSVDCDAIVVALKTRSIPAEQAVEQSLAATAALQEHGCSRFFFKYCSTFDSTSEGNIGPVADAMLDYLQTDRSIVCPAFPRNARTVYQGHLFVGNRLLNDSGMQHHPLNPMQDADLVRFLATQSKNSIGLLNHAAIESGAANLKDKLDELTAAGKSLLVTDCCDDRHLQVIAEAVGDLPLITGGSGIARYLPDAWRKLGLLQAVEHQPHLPQVAGRSLILAGSCSQATRRQVAVLHDKCHAHQIDVARLLADRETELAAVESLVQQAAADSRPVMIYSTAAPEAVEFLQQKFGREQVSQSIESFHAEVAKRLTEQHGVRRIVIAGGETSGAVMNGLGIRRLRIGPEICAGVPWTESDDSVPLALALKSGNFGDDQFFQTALDMLP